MSLQDDILCLLFLSVFVCAIFSPTLFANKDISRIGTIAHRDTLFSRLAKGTIDAMDTTIYQEHAPNYYLAEKLIAQGQLPLWNPYLGLGTPMWSDSQVLAFSPITWLQAPFASMRLYNLLEVFHVWLGAVFAYLFARVLGLSPGGSTLASLSFGFVPYLLYMLEWTRFQNVFTPLPFLGFALLWRKPGRISIVVCALLSTLMIVSGHTIPSVFVMAYASLLYFGLVYLLPQKAGNKKLSPIAPVLSYLSVGLLTFCLSAPVVVPFVETMRASYCYKDDMSGLRYIVKPTALLPSLLFPFYASASPYAGASAILLSLSSLFISRKNRRLTGLVLGVALIVLLSMIRFGPFDFVFGMKVLNWFMLIYALPSFLLLTAIAAGLGYDSLVQEKLNWKAVLPVAAVVLIPLSVPFLYKAMHLSQSQMILNDWVTTMKVAGAVRTREVILLILSVATIFGLTKCSIPLRAKLSFALIVINAISLAFLFKTSLPARPAFEYAEIEPIPFLREQKRRILSMGRHVLVPNTSQLFFIANLVSFMPTHPHGVIDYLRAMGVTLEGVGQYAEMPLNKLIDLASVKYVISNEPVLSTEDHLPELVPFNGSTGIEYGEGLKLLAWSTEIDASNRDIVGKLQWQNETHEKGHEPIYVAMIIKEDGSLIWIGDRKPVKPSQDVFTAVIPKSLKTAESAFLVLQVIDPVTAQLIAPQSLPENLRLKSVPKSLVLRRFAAPSGTGVPTSSGRHFRLISESIPEMIRVYENTKCLPEAFLAASAIFAPDVKTALAEIEKPDFDLQETVTSEDRNLCDELSAGGARQNAVPKVVRPNVNEVLVDAQSDGSSVLVLSDVAFPGWKVFVDGKESKILKVDAIFRGVRLSNGHHQIKFVYDPLSIKLGFVLFALGIFASVLFLRIGKRIIVPKDAVESD